MADLLGDAFPGDDLTDLRAAFACAIPADAWPDGWDGGVERLLVEHGGDFLAESIPRLQAAIVLLNAAAELASGGRFAELAEDDRETVFAGVLADDDAARGGSGALSELLTIAYQGFYAGTREPAGWSMVGFRPVPEGVEPLDPEPLAGIALGELREHYDAVVVGAGAGGGVVAAELTAAGLEVLVLERSQRRRDSELRGNHLQGKRIERYDVLAGPGAGSPRVLELDDGTTRILRGDGSGQDYGLNAMTAGGGTRLWQGMSWRFYAEDFAMAAHYGTPEDSTLADWPFGYDELEPYYDRVEWELGVSGDATSDMSRRTPRTRGYPMPALPSDASRVAYGESATRLGLHASPIPFSINSVPYQGRGACVRCAQCLGHACPVNAKNGSHNTFLPRALATGRGSVLFSAQATRVEHDERGRATGVRVVVDAPGGPVERVVGADRVIVAAGAIESPRLLLASGLGNDWVGRNLHAHGFVTAFSYETPDLQGWDGPGHSVASVDWVHHDGEAWGGGVMFDQPPAYPVVKAEFGRALAPVPFGRAHKRWMRETNNGIGATSMVQEVPHARSQVMIDPVVKDRFGMPVARVRGVSHWATREASEYMLGHCSDWIADIGAKNIQSFLHAGGAHGGEHTAGTARLGIDPALSACDPNGRLHGTRNVYVADASVHPTNGGFNPTLTIMANAMRIASRMLR